MKYFILAIKKAFDFKSRSSRPEFWYFFLFQVIFALAAMIIDRVLGTTFKMDMGLGAGEQAGRVSDATRRQAAGRAAAGSPVT
jgi:uncharacterized membrane protein YhaH (DUF805 family)